MLTLAQAADELGLAAATLRWQIANGKLKARKFGNSWVITRRELERYRIEHQRTARGPS